MKKVISIVLIAILIVLGTTLSAGQHLIQVQANTIHWQYQVGYNYTLPGGYDAFNECVHTHWQYSDNTYVGIGMSAGYDVASYNNYGIYRYNSGQWIFEAGYGYNWDYVGEFYGSPTYTYNVNQYGYFSGTSFYETSSAFWCASGWKMVRTYYPSQGNYATFNPVAYAISGQTYAAFRDPDYPNNVWYLSASPPPENSYDVLTAQAGPPRIVSWDD